jgi:hypothetical protein
MRSHLRFSLLVFVALMAFAGFSRPSPSRAQTPPDWLVAMNNIRTAAGLPAVTESTASSTGARNHSLYVVRNNNLTHVEDPNAPGFTTDGAQAGQTGDVGAQFGGGPPPLADAVGGFMTGGYHWEPVLSPTLTSVGYGAASFADAFPGQTPPAGAITGADTLVLNRGVGGHTQTIMWPPNGGTMPFTTYGGGETPDPLASCAGYTTPTGASLSLQLTSTPQVTAATLTKVGVQGNLDSCWFTNATVQFNPNDQAWVSTGHNILGNANAVVIFPKQPLTNGTYCASVTNNGTPINWSFTVGTAPVAPPPPCGQNTGTAANQPTTTTTTNTPNTPNTTTITTNPNTPTTTTTTNANPNTPTTTTTTNTNPTTPPATTTTTTNTNPTTTTTTTTTNTNPAAPTTTTTTPNTTTNANPPTTTTTDANTNPTTGAVATPSWGGTWNSDFGTLTLTQNGNQVNGAFQDQTAAPGTITGTAAENTLNANWSLAPNTPGLAAITLVLTVSPDGSSFTGTFDDGQGFSGNWSGMRTGP